MADPQLKINEHDLSREMADQAGNYFYIAEKSVRAEASHNTEKFKLETLMADIDNQIRARAEAEGKKITEKLIEKEIERHPMYKDQRISIIKAKANMDLMKANREAWYSRKDMLVQLAIKERGDIEALNNRVSAQG